MQHIIANQVFIARMANAETQAMIILADMPIDGFQAVMACRPATQLGFDLAGR